MPPSSPTSDSQASPVAPPPAAVRPFDAEEQAAFLEEDGQAGKVIASLLGFFFLYTIVVTTIATWWTWEAVH